MEPCNVLVQIRLPHVKQSVISSIANLVWDLPHELPNDVRTAFLPLGGSFAHTRKKDLGS